MTFSNAAKKFIQKLPPKHARQIQAKLDALRQNPVQEDRRPMTDYPDIWRLDCGEYRIGYTEHKTATEHLLVIDWIDRRNDDTFYKNIKRRLR